MSLVRFIPIQTQFLTPLNHWQNEEMHNYEMDLGAANALCLKLGYILLSGERNNDFFMEVEMVCASLKMVHGCSVQRRIHSFHDIGFKELLPLLLQVLSFTEIGSSHAILQALHVIRVYSKLNEVKTYLVHTPSLWKALLPLIWSFECRDEIQWIILEKDAETVQLEIMGVIKDLSFRTTDQDKLVVYNTKGVIPTLLHFGRKMEARRLREQVAAVWWNLAMSPSVAQEMANNVDVLTSLHHLMLPNDSIKTRRNAISSIGNLATVPINHEQLLSHEDGALIQCLEAAAKLEDDTDSRRRAMRTLRCLCSGEVAHNLRRRIDFCEFLAHVAQNDVDRDTRVQALECIAYVAADEKAMTVVGGDITKALIGTIENSNESRLTIDACTSLALCLSEYQAISCRSLSCLMKDETRIDFSTTFYAKLAAAVTDSLKPEAHQLVAKIVLYVVEMDGFVEKEPSTAFLNLLVALLSPVSPDFQRSQDIAMNAIVALADVDGNKKVLAEDEGLLTALVNFAMVTGEAEKKDGAKTLILKLIPEL